MIAGRHLFEGEDVGEVLAAVIKDEPEWEAIPIRVRRLLRSCLQKDPKKRLRDIADVWLLLDEAPIRAITDAVGFRFTYDAKHDQFAHASGIMVLTPKGKIARYFYDVTFSPRDLRLGLVEAAENKIGSSVDQILLFCFHYDPAEGRYGPVIMSFVRLGGVLTVLALGTFFAVLWRGEKRRSRLSIVGQDSNPDMSKACQDWNPDPQPGDEGR